MSKENNIKEKFKIALISTEKAISDDYSNKNNKIKKKTSELNYFEIDSLNSKEEFVKYRAESDSRGLKKKFSNEEIYKLNYPKNPSCNSLYEFSEKIRCELLGSEMLKGSKVNFIENYKNTFSKVKTDHIRNKDDVKISQAFELYMLKKVFNLNINKDCEKILSYWYKELHEAFDNNIQFFQKNLQNQNEYNSKVSEILQNMSLFENNDETQNNDENQDNEDETDNNNENHEQNSDQNQSSQESKEDSKSIDADYDFAEHQLGESLVDEDNEKESSENVMIFASHNKFSSFFSHFF